MANNGGEDSAHGGSSGKLSVPSDSEKALKPGVEPAPSFRTDIGKGTWYYAGSHMATTIATPAAYAYLPFAFASLGWEAGTVMLLLGIVTTWYASLLLSELHEMNGTRYVRYRDIGNAIYGKHMSRSIVAFQQIASLANNITLGIVAGTSMKALDQSFNPGSGVTLQGWIAVFGFIQLLLSQFPTIHDLRLLNVFCTLCTIGFAVSATALSIYNGKNPPPDSPPVDYTVSATVFGSTANVVFGAFSALGTIAFGFGDTILPEIQATVKDPVVSNMKKAVNLCYATLASSYIMTTFTGYWAYGNMVTPYLVASFAGPTWAVRLCNFFALFQIVGCYQIYCRPTYEVLEEYAMDTNQKPLATRNILGRFVVTFCYCALLTFVGCLFPFFGDFLALGGAIGFTPLDFVIPLVLWTAFYKPSTPRALIHYAVALFYTGIGIVGAIGAIRFIIIDSANYSVFVNL